VLIPGETAREMADRIARTVAIVRASPFIPVEPSDKQWAILCDPRKELFWGGSVGTGKTVCFLAAALMYVHVPGYQALMIRRSFPALSQQGGLMQTAEQWLYNTAARKRESGKLWEFPSGATLRFDHLETDADRLKHDGASLQFVFFDEVTQITELSYTFLFSRLRRSLANKDLAEIPLRQRCAGNPTGKHAGWVVDRFVKPLTPMPPDRVFYPSIKGENPYIDQEEYADTLSKLDPYSRQQMEEGDWEAKPEGLMFSADSFRYVDRPLSTALRRIRVWDFAASEEMRSDYSVGALMALAPTGEYVVEHVVRDRLDPGKLERLIRATADADGRSVHIVVEKQPGAAGLMAMRDLKQRVLHDRIVHAVSPTGSKSDRAMLPSALGSQQKIVLVKAGWNYDLVDEACAFPDSVHDDQIDSLSLGCHFLSKFAPRNLAPAPPREDMEAKPKTPNRPARLVRGGGWGISVPTGGPSRGAGPRLPR
jgi:predicted phage terminase large subunit-like protein